MKPPKKFLFLLVAILAGCASASEEKKLRDTGRKMVQEMTGILKEVENQDELEEASFRLKKKFNQLAQVILEVRRWKGKHPESSISDDPLEESDALFAELARLYEIPGCREVIEQAQGEAVRKLLPTAKNLE